MNGKLTTDLSYHLTWEVPNFFALPMEMDCVLECGEFRFAGDLYCVLLYPNYFSNVFILLAGSSSSVPQKDVSYEIGCRLSNGEEFSFTKCNPPVESVGGIGFCKVRRVLEDDRDRYVPGGILTLYCRICTRSELQQERPPELELVTSPIQTDVTNCVLKKENRKDEDCSSLDTKDDRLLRERMKELLTKGSDHDVTICVQEKEFRAHRNILSIRSPVFAMMLSHDTKEKNTGTISIEDCDPESFEEFLLYVYCGRTENLTPSNALRLYYPADKYDFPVLKERCISLLKTSLSVESICDVVLLAAKHQEKELLKVATEFFARNMKRIVVTVSWQKFMPQNPVEANELIVKSMEILQPED